MDLCKFGIHDYEIIGKKTYLSNFCKEYLLSEGFVYHKSTISRFPSYSHLDTEDVTIDECGWGDYHNVNDCYPRYPFLKVCLNCGKVKKNYDETKIIKKLDELIQYEFDQSYRRLTAKRLSENY